MTDNLLVVENLTKRFGTPDGSRQTVIENLSFAVGRGARVTIFAPSSAGKTTLIDILAGLDRDYEGSFWLAAAHPATICQEPRLFPYMTVEENVFVPARLRGIPITSSLTATYRRWLDVCDLSPFAHHYPYQLSGGMKQKVALIRGYLTGPDFVMMDEPFKSIDLPSKQAIIRHILDAYPEVTVLFVTHDIEEVPLLTDSLLLFKTNRLAEHLTKEVRQGARSARGDLMEAIYG